MSLRRLFGISLLLIIGGPAQANPMATSVVRFKQMPGSTHVQVTYGVDAKIETLVTPLSIQRDGAALTSKWTPYSPFSTNTGSGLRDVDATQLCDCHLSMGMHTYTLKLRHKMFGKITEDTRTVKFHVVQPSAAPKDAGPASADLMPWSIPDPKGVQGLDCNTPCAKVPRPDSGLVMLDAAAQKKDAGGTMTPDQGARARKDTGAVKGQPIDRDGCSVAAPPDGLPPLLVLALMGLVLRRRK